ncbi:hypothetical protein [Synoicihabitans lomoniglobus]|uniref:Uncharacterized protein n=1 Tax=Synoicihabitans lomoniglobus TaxID=2909285 RepID=A0AAE9ZQQ4_9BACT|nr:hypothetical protein [Opitutaceae bacterium LMO-M01]WED63345.1 hypothetical protein PXH66_13485 [Opitutaceae bacterium LMO-M01]
MSQPTPSPDGESRRKFIGSLGAAALAGAALPVRGAGASAEQTVDAPAHDDQHICMGLNTKTTVVAGISYAPGECPATNVDSHGCAGGNSCANLGGCGTGDYGRQYWITDNACGTTSPHWNGTGGCGAPIGHGNSGFVSTQLNSAAPDEIPGKPGQYYSNAFIGKPVWNIARSRFEKKMVIAGKSFGKPASLPSALIANAWSGSGHYDPNGLPEPYPTPMPPKLPKPPKVPKAPKPTS